MARINIDIGTLGNPATGDTLRTAMTKINTNFTEVYSLVRDGSSGLIATDVTNGDLKLQANGTGVIEIDQLQISGDSITSLITNGSVDLTGNGTGGVNIEALHFNGTSINSTDSSRINLNENVTVDGDLLVTGNITGTFTVSSVDADSTTVSNLEVDNFKASAIVIESEGISSNDNDTTLPTSAAVKDYVDTNSVTASETATFTNKTFDANGSGNSISNIEVADFAAASIVTEAEGIGSNDNDTTLPTSAAVKDYVDTQVATVPTGDITSVVAGAGLTGGGTTGDVTLNVVGGTGIDANANDIAIDSTVVTLTGAQTLTNKVLSDPTVTGTATIGAVTTNVINSNGSNADLSIQSNSTGDVIIEGIRFNGTTLDSSDSSKITIAEALDVSGNLNVTGNITGTVTGTIDADNSTISNLEVDNFKASAIVTEGEGIGSNDNDTTIPTSAAVKDYVDSNPTTSLAADNLTTGDAAINITTTTGDITLDAQANNRDIIFKGTDGGVDITPLQIDMSEGGKAIFQADIQGQGVTISDNTITSNRSNDNLELAANGTGNVKILTDQITLGTGSSAGTEAVAIGKNTNAGNYAQAIGNNAGNSGQGQGAVALGSEAGETDQGNKAVAIGNYAGETTQGANAIAIGEKAGQTSQAANSIVINATGAALNNTTASSMVVKPIRNASGTHQLEYNPTTGEVTYDTLASGGATGDLTITGSTISAPSNADLTLTTSGTGSVSVDAIQIKGTELSSSDSTQITIKENLHVTGTLSVAGSTLSGTLNTAGNTGTGSVALASESLQVLGTTNEINVDAAAFALSLSLADDISGITSVTAGSFLANDAIKIVDNQITGLRSNEDIQIDPAGTGGIVAQGPVTFNAGYIEKINTLTSSSTITVNCATASIHTVTLGTNTEFNITNLPTGGTVTLIITQDGTGNRTATYGTDGSSAVKFPSNSSTLSTGAGDIDVVTIINDGTNFLGNIAKDYRSS